VPSASLSILSRRFSQVLGWFAHGLPYFDLTTPRATYVMRSILAAWLGNPPAKAVRSEVEFSH